jgi:hypothetical protein
MARKDRRRIIEESKGIKRSRESKKRKSALDKAKPLGRGKIFKRPSSLEGEEETAIVKSRKENAEGRRPELLKTPSSSSCGNKRNRQLC